MRSRLLPSLAALCLFASPAQAAPPAQRAMVVLLDGAGTRMLDQMRQDGGMSRLVAMEKGGARIDRLIAGAADSTAAAHAALWTGAPARLNGVPGDRAPKRPLKEHTLLETQGGYSADALTAEPFFAGAARAGRSVVTLDLPQTSPFEVYSAAGRFGHGVGDRLAIVDGAAGVLEDDGIWSQAQGLTRAEGWSDLPASRRPALETRYKLAGEWLEAALIDDPKDPHVGYNTLLINSEKSGRHPLARLKPSGPSQDPEAAWSGAVALHGPDGFANVRFRLFGLSPSGRHFMLYHTAPARLQANHPELLPAIDQAGGDFAPGGAARLYAQGALGTPIAEGGDGLAEARYLETARFAIARARRRALALAAERPWNLYVVALPFPDEAEHLWYGQLMPGSPAYRPAAAARLAPFVRGLYDELDAYIGALRGAAGANTDFLVVGDHGMKPAGWDFYPNVVLRQAGLLRLDGDNQIDLAHTAVLYGLEDGGFVVANTTAHAGGWVKPVDAPKLLAQARFAINRLSVKTPGGIVPLLTRTRLEGDRLYLGLQDGYAFNVGFMGDDMFKARAPEATGAHAQGLSPLEDSGLLIALGPDFRPGATLKSAWLQDVAPTLCRALGVPAPAQARGKVLGSLLRR